MAENLTLTTDIYLGFYCQLTKDLIVPYFLQNPFLRPQNSIVPLFSSDNIVKCAFLRVIFAARRLIISELGVLLKRIRRFVSPEILHYIYNALVQPHFEYCSFCLG